MYDTLQPLQRKAWAGRAGRGYSTGSLRTQQGPQCLLFSPWQMPTPVQLPAHTLKCSWPHFLQPWEAAGMRKTHGTQGGSEPTQALTICMGHTVQPRAQTVGRRFQFFSPPFGASSSLTLNKVKLLPHPKCGREAVPSVFPKYFSFLMCVQHLQFWNWAHICHLVGSLQAH